MIVLSAPPSSAISIKSGLAPPHGCSCVPFTETIPIATEHKEQSLSRSGSPPERGWGENRLVSKDTGYPIARPVGFSGAEQAGVIENRCRTRIMVRNTASIDGNPRRRSNRNGGDRFILNIGQSLTSILIEWERRGGSGAGGAARQRGAR